MPALSPLNASQLVTLAGLTGDSAGQIGQWKLEQVTGFFAAIPDYPNASFEEVSGLLEGIGLDPNALTSGQLVLAMRAMAYIMAYDLLNQNATAPLLIVGENFASTQTAFKLRIKQFWDMAGDMLTKLGVAHQNNPYLNFAAFSVSVGQVTPRDGNKNYPYQNG